MKAKGELQSQGHQLIPSNYHTCFNIIKFVFKAILVILGFGKPFHTILYTNPLDFNCLVCRTSIFSKVVISDGTKDLRP